MRELFKCATAVLCAQVLLISCLGVARGKYGEQFADLRIAVCPWDSGALVDKAGFEVGRQAWTAATAHLDRGLKQNSRSFAAYKLKAEMAFQQNDFDSALKFVDLADKNDFNNVKLKALILNRMGDFQRSFGHNTYIAKNGAIEVKLVATNIVIFTKPGANGKGVWE